MGFATSLLLIAVGAILRFAVSVSTSGFNLHTGGVILMAVGGVGFLLSLIWVALSADRNTGPAPPRGARGPASDVPPGVGGTDPRY